MTVQFRATIRRRVFLFAAISLAPVFMAAFSPSADAFEAGAAKVEITPPLGTPLNGYGARLGRGAVEVHDPLWVRCLYLDDGNTKLFLVNADLCLINPELREKVLEMAPDVVPHERIVLTATHNHSGQGAMIRELLFRSISGRFMPEILDMTASRFAQAMREAYQARQRATLGYATFEQQDMSRNRREKDGPIDPQIGVIRVEDADGAPIAVVANFAAHPTTVGDNDALSVSADYVGYYYDELETVLGRGCVAMFMNGAEGNQSCAGVEGKSGWERTESIGRALAQRVAKAAVDIHCGDVTITTACSTPDLPLTLGAQWFPAKAYLQTVEIDDLLLTFYPGEPCVELGLAMRERALARGYAAQFTVGLSNDYLAYFAPRSYYSKPYYENMMNFYGPGIGNWFSREFTKLMTKGAPEPAPEPEEVPAVERLGAGGVLRLQGSHYEMGYQRGRACQEAIQEAYQAMVVVPCSEGLLLPNTGWWQEVPGFLDVSRLGLIQLAYGARGLLDGVSGPVFDELEGLAAGAQLPFDAVWLLHCAPLFAQGRGIDDFFSVPFCTMFAAVGDRAGADEILVGRNFDWTDAAQPLLVETLGTDGKRMAVFALPWSAGAFTGMNQSGLVVCAERVESLGESSLVGPPIEIVLREVLESADSVAAAEALLAAATHLRGYHVLMADGHADTARVIEIGSKAMTRKPEDGLLMGVVPGTAAGEAATARYGRLGALLVDERIVSVPEIMEFLADTEGAASGQNRILNGSTQYSVVFEPKRQIMHVAFVGQDGMPSEYATISLNGGNP